MARKRIEGIDKLVIIEATRKATNRFSCNFNAHMNNYWQWSMYDSFIAVLKLMKFKRFMGYRIKIDS